MPTLQHLGVSRKIEDEIERERLRTIVQKLEPTGGVIVRTAGEGASEENLRADLEYLDRLWKEVRANYEKRKKPGPIHVEMDVELRALRDLLSDQVNRVVVDDQQAFERITRFVIATSVRPRLTVRTAPGKRARNSLVPSRWFSRAHPRRVRS